MSDETVDRDPFEKLADSFLCRFRAGERPSIEEYAARHPELADEIRELLPALVDLEQNLDPDEEFAALRSARSMPAATPRHLGDYLILREVGRGGMGIVYEAVQQSLGRHVALKVVPAGSLGGSSHLERFRLESRSAARLHHSNIVPVFGVGEQDGAHYYAMQFIHGQGLDAIIDELRRLRENPTAVEAQARTPATDGSATMTRAVTEGLLSGRFVAADYPGRAPSEPESPVEGTAPTLAESAESADASTEAAIANGSSVGAAHPETAPISGAGARSELSSAAGEVTYVRSVARVCLQVAEALAYAHGEGVLHRDIKPSNLMLDAKGNVWVTDFGLAKAEGSDGLTRTGDIVGTLRYMAPERFDGWSDPRSDVYALGATLYELLTLRPAFEESSRAKLIERILHDSPTSPRKADRKIPRDLETIIFKAMAREPRQRYHSAEAMAEDLQRYLADRPVLARRATSTERVVRWCRRNPALASSSALAFAGLLAAVIILAVSTAQARDQSASLRLALGAKEGALTGRDKALFEKDLALTGARTQEALAKANAIKAEASFAQARRAVDKFLSQVTDNQLLKAPGLQALRRDLLSSALTFYEQFIRERGDDQALRAAMAGVRLRTGYIRAELGESKEARDDFEAARAIFETLDKTSPGNRETRSSLAECQFRLGNYTEAIAIWAQLLKVDPANPRYRSELAAAYNARALDSDISNTERVESHRKALALREELVRNFPDDPEARRDLGGTLNNIGVLLNQQSKHHDALAMYVRGVEHAEAAFEKSPNIVVYGRFLLTGYSNVAYAYDSLGRFEEAERWFGKAIDFGERLVRDNPAVPVYRSTLYTLCYKLGAIHARRGNASRATELRKRAALLIEKLQHRSAAALYDLACVRAQIAATIGEPGSGSTLDSTPERDRMMIDAIQALNDSIDAGFTDLNLLRTDADLKILRGHSAFRNVVDRLQRVETANGLLASASAGTPEQKLNAHKQVLTTRTILAHDHPTSRRHRADLAASLYAVGRILTDIGPYDDARKALDEALAARETLAREEPRNTRARDEATQTRLALGQLNWKAGRLADADRDLRAGLHEFEAGLLVDPGNSDLIEDLVSAEVNVGEGIYAVSGLWDEARACFERAATLRPNALAPIHSFYLALLRLEAGDVAGYRAECARLVTRFASSGNKTDASLDVIRACVLAPEAVADPERLIPLSQQLLAQSPDDYWTKFCHALVLTRCGRYPEARAAIDRFRGPNDPIHSWPALALIEHHLGHPEEARRWLAKADRWTEEIGNKALESPGPLAVAWWIDFPYVEILRREAHALLDGSPKAGDPYRALRRSFLFSKMGRADEADALLAQTPGLRTDDAKLMAAYARVLSETASDGTGAKAAWARAFALFDDALARSPRNAAILKNRATTYVAHGDWDKAAADFAAASRAEPGRGPAWIVAGWWVVGPYPLDRSALQTSLATALPPETQTDPFQRVAGPSDKQTLAWKKVAPSDDGFLDLRPLFEPSVHCSSYVMARVYARSATNAAFLVTNDDWIRLWCNGELLVAQDLQLNPPRPGPIRLRAGWNTILARVSNYESGYSMRLRLTDDVPEIGRAFGAYVDSVGWNNEVATLLNTAYSLIEPGVAAWQPRSTFDVEIVRRDELFGHAAVLRPEDAQLWVARGRYLAWRERWDDAIAAYARASTILGAEARDAQFEAACLPLLKGDDVAYQRSVEQLVTLLNPSSSRFASYILARAVALRAGAIDDPSRLVAWSNRYADERPDGVEVLHVQGLARLRAGLSAQAIEKFVASIAAYKEWSHVENWYGLALAYHQSGRDAEARVWFDRAQDWMEQKRRETADKETHPLPPVALTDWLETLVLQREAERLLGSSVLVFDSLVDQTVSAGEAFSTQLVTRDTRRVSLPEKSPAPLTLQAPFRTKPPTQDGRIAEAEYGRPLSIDFTGDANPGRLWTRSEKPVRDRDDMSAELFVACTATDLCLAVRVRDDVVLTSSTDFVPNGDSVEFYLDGDRVANDFDRASYQQGRASREGFQLGVDCAGRSYSSLGIAQGAYQAAAGRWEHGYVVELRIPLNTIDTTDGAEVSPAGPGAVIRFNLAVVDNDQARDRQERVGVLWSDNSAESPWSLGEAGWPVDLVLGRPVTYELVSGPLGAWVAPETGVFNWPAPREPQTARVTVRARDGVRPALFGDGTFSIVTKRNKP